MASSHRVSGTRGRFAGAAVVTALVAGGLMASLGAGYSVSRAALSDGSAYVAKGTTAAHVNGESGKIDAQTPGNLAKGKQGLTLVTLASGQVVAINEATGVATIVDGPTMNPTSTIEPGPPEGAPGVDTSPDVRAISSGKSGWLVNTSAGRLTLLDKPGASGKQTDIGAPVTDAAPGPDGSIIVLTKDGVIIRVGTDLKAHRTPITDGAGGALTAAGGRTFLFTTGGDVLRVDGNQPRTLAKPDGLDANVIAGSVEGSGEHVLAVEHDVLLLIEPNNGGTQNIVLHAGKATLGRPVELGGRVYIPDYTNHQLIVANSDTGQLQKAIKVPGTTSTFALFVSGGRVWANDQFSQRMIAIDSDGSDHRIDKGTGKGVEDPDAKPTKIPPKTKNPPTKIPPGSTNPGGQTTPIPKPVTPRPGTVIPVPAGSAPPKLVAVPSFGSNTDYHDACAQIEALQLRCTPVAVSADGQTGNTDDVFNTQPSGGTKVPVGSQVVVTYLGQLAVPDRLTGATPNDACSAIVAAQLTCDPQPTAAPAANSTDFGTVNAVNPASGTKVDKGTKVTVSYPDKFVMPSFQGQAGSAACTQLQAYVLDLNGTPTTPTCAARAGNTAPTAPQVGQVYGQQPAAALPATANAAVTLDVYNGNVTVKNWAGMDGNAALAECNATPGLSCAPLAAGSSAANQPARAGTVETQSPAPGTYPVVANVTITVFRGDNVVPNVTGGDKDAGCGAIQAAGFVCGDAPGLVGPSRNLVVSQDQGAGATLPLGSTVTYHYSPVQAEEIATFQVASGEPVWKLGFVADGTPAGYEGGSAHVGYAYRPGTAGIDRAVNSYFCTGGAARCEGYSVNHFYSQSGAPYSSGGIAWDGPKTVMMTMGSCPAGTTHLWRTWLFASANDHRYFIEVNANTPGGKSGAEDLSCIWP